MKVRLRPIAVSVKLLRSAGQQGGSTREHCKPQSLSQEADTAQARTRPLCAAVPDSVGRVISVMSAGHGSRGKARGSRDIGADALVRVVHISRLLQAVEGSVGHVVPQQPLRHPLPPL
jgi:hypothetical protein